MIGITEEKYEELIMAKVRISILKDMVNKEQYFNRDDVRAVLGLPEKEDAAE